MQFLSILLEFNMKTCDLFSYLLLLAILEDTQQLLDLILHVFQFNHYVILSVLYFYLDYFGLAATVLATAF